MWQYWQHNISEEAKKYGYGEDRILRESKIKAAAEAWFNSLPKECLTELKQRVGKAIAAANTKNVPLLPTDLMNIQLILKAHKVKPLLGSMQASVTAVETMMQSDRLESLESVEDENIINEGFRPEDYGYRVDQLASRDGKPFVIYKLSYSGGSIRFMDGRMGTVISRFATVREALAETKRLAKKDYPTAQIEGVETQGDTITEYKTSTGTPKFVGKYQFTPFVEGSISGWFIRVQGFAKEVGFVEKPASKNTKTSTAPYKVYFHTETMGHPQLKATALPGNETRVIQSNQFRFAPKQLLKGVAMWMDAYGYRMVGEGLESVEEDGEIEVTESIDVQTAKRRFSNFQYKKSSKTVSGDNTEFVLHGVKETELKSIFGAPKSSGGMKQWSFEKDRPLDHQFTIEFDGSDAYINSSRKGNPTVRDHIKGVFGMMGLRVTTESVEVDGDTITERSDFYEIEGNVDGQIAGAKTLPTMQEAEYYAKMMLAHMKKFNPKAKTITVHIYKNVNYERIEKPMKVLTVAEGIDVSKIDIEEAKKKLTSDQKAALKAYKLSCDMRDRDDQTPDMYRHYEKRAKADAEACRKLGLGKEDGVYESVHADSAQVIEGRIKQHDSIYFDSYTAALAAARAKAEKKGYEIDEEDWASQVTHGFPGRPSVEKTTNKKINLTKKGKPVKPRLIISVYGMKNGFELTSYISEEVEMSDTSLIEATYNKAKAKNPKTIVVEFQMNDENQSFWVVSYGDEEVGQFWTREKANAFATKLALRYGAKIAY